LQTDLRNAGATWTDEAMVRDTGLVTSRKPDDLKQFNQAAIALFAA
jgi:protease I